MSAQQQLASLFRDFTGDYDAYVYRGECTEFIMRHGPAIAELIEACRIFVGDPELLSHACIDAALRKLTQDATT